MLDEGLRIRVECFVVRLSCCLKTAAEAGFVRVSSLECVVLYWQCGTVSQIYYGGKGIGNCPLHQVKVSDEGFRIRVKCFVCLSCSASCRSGKIFKGEYCGSV